MVNAGRFFVFIQDSKVLIHGGILDKNEEYSDRLKLKHSLEK